MVVDRNGRWSELVLYHPSVDAIFERWRGMFWPTEGWLAYWRMFLNQLVRGDPGCVGNLGRLPQPDDFAVLELFESCRCQFEV